MQTKHYVALAAAVGLAIGVGGWLLLAPKTAVAPNSSTTASTTVTDLGNGTQIQATGDVTVTQTNQNAAPKPPALRSINFSVNTSADLKTALQSQYATISAQIKAAPNRVDLWLQLGVLYKIGGDYAGAAAAWTYVAQAAPASIAAVAYGNLGDLYLNFTREYQKAEVSYKAALALKPGYADYQAGLGAARQAQGK